MNPFKPDWPKARGRLQRGEPRGHCCAGRAAASAVDRMGRPEADPLLRLGAAGHQRAGVFAQRCASTAATQQRHQTFVDHRHSDLSHLWRLPAYLFGRSGAVNIMRGRFTRTDTELQPHYATPLDRAAMPQDPALQNQIHYLQTQAHCLPARNTDVTYYGDTNAALEAQKTDLRKAQHFILWSTTPSRIPSPGRA